MPVTPESVSERVSVRLDEEQRAKIAAWMNVHQVDQVSTALRALLDLGITRAENLAPELSRRMVREGFKAGYAAFNERVSVLFEEMRAETKPK